MNLRRKIQEDEFLSSTAVLSTAVAADEKEREMVCPPFEKEKDIRENTGRTFKKRTGIILTNPDGNLSSRIPVLFPFHSLSLIL